MREPQRCSWAIGLTLIALALSLTPAKVDGGEQAATAGPTDPNLRYLIGNMDEADLVLLDRAGIQNDPDWRHHFSGQVLGFGIRTGRRHLSSADLAKVKALLLVPDNWEPGDKDCTTAGDAALLMRGREGEVTVLLELWCGRAYVRDETLTNLMARGIVDPMVAHLRALAVDYFPNDRYLRELREKH